ncbi:MAG: DUF5320 domain-containing protein, partial [Deltaproteobacteria bacterium]|nr:DUF5320 domain-containing protein [Deltaproteobacteria bacterium]
MPGGDRRGPQGMGPMTGRAAGYCAGYPMPGFANPMVGGGFGGGLGRGSMYGRGGGRGWRNRFYATGLTGWQRGFHGYPINAGGGVPFDMPYAFPYNPPQYTKEMEIEGLKSQAEYFEDSLE